MKNYHCVWVFFIILQCTLGTSPILMETSTLLELFQDPYCISLIHDESVTQIQTFSTKVTIGNLNLIGNQKQQYCKAVLVSLDLEQFLQRLTNQSSLFHKEGAQFILVVQNRSWRDLLSGSRFFDKITNLAVLDLTDRSFYTKSLCGSSSFLKIGVYVGHQLILNRSDVFQEYSDISCQSLKATAFHYAPFTIVSEDEKGNRTYSGLEVT